MNHLDRRNKHTWIPGKSCSIPVTDEIKNTTILLRRKYNIKLPDAIIAATSIENDLALITADAGFKKISELNLELITPYTTI